MRQIRWALFQYFIGYCLVIKLDWVTSDDMTIEQYCMIIVAFTFVTSLTVAIVLPPATRWLLFWLGHEAGGIGHAGHHQRREPTLTATPALQWQAKAVGQGGATGTRQQRPARYEW